MSKKLCEKKILYAGHSHNRDPVEWRVGTKITFHFVTKSLDGKVLDDSRKWSKPMELILGKKFRLEIWETALSTMRIGEISSFTVDKRATYNYPVVAKTLRDSFIPGNKKKEARGHTCSMMTMSVEGGLGYDDLNQLIKDPASLEFIMELISAESPDEYEKENWQMNPEEKRNSLSKLRLQGNELFRGKKYKEAALQYAEAIGRLEQLILREKPQDDPWHELRKEKVPLLLNYSQCKLLADEYYAVIEHTSEVLEIDPDNVKALFRRGKAHIGAWNPIEAKSDFQRVSILDPSLAKTCAKEIKFIESLEKEKDFEDKEKLKNIFT
ncbi:AH receptor-interacting protein [Lepeophtheirus salmonis]|uniref:AH receptor-interacting protein n=1 Tax=Lepeophtheirus salmonis TaxID=72036 RepID=UPI001AE32506|nr:AH receptor-interacting protein-like [Lepeophtheirus salmonis]